MSSVFGLIFWRLRSGNTEDEQPDQFSTQFADDLKAKGGHRPLCRRPPGFLQ
jgi:hypothetical protein